ARISEGLGLTGFRPIVHEQEGEAEPPMHHVHGTNRIRPSSYRALRSAVSTLARLDDFSREKIGVQHRVSGQVMALKMNILASNRANMLREVQLMNRLSHPNILRFIGVCVHEGQLHALTEVRLINVLQHRWLVHLEVLLLFSFLFSCSEEEGQEPLAVVGSPYWMAPEVLRGEVYNEKVDVFAYGIILCEIIARIQADPDILPRTEDFGLDVEAFRHMVADCPSHFLNLAIACCNMNAKLRPSFSQIVAELEKKQAERKQKAEPAVKGELFCRSTSPPVSPVRRRSLGLLLDQRLSRSKSDMLHPSETPPTATLAPPARFNPFSQREDLKGGKIKLFDTPSKSVISLTFTLPPPPDCDDTTASDADAVDMPRRHRRCHSLPCTPPPHLTSAPNTVLSEESHSGELSRSSLKFAQILTQQYSAYFPDTLFGAQVTLKCLGRFTERLQNRLIFSNKAVGRKTFQATPSAGLRAAQPVTSAVPV
uniref:Testis associated actin remodelling kinase 1 n=1 Tax=Neolamprologus brichardi TaxID=32507 RepID=A0A3Q4GQZ3_NEOBR